MILGLLRGFFKRRVGLDSLEDVKSTIFAGFGGTFGLLCRGAERVLVTILLPSISVSFLGDLRDSAVSKQESQNVKLFVKSYA